MDGVLNVCKPPGMTSHDVVAWVRRATGERKAGHTGTLDPSAAGVLPVCLGRATVLADYVAGADKAYRCEVRFGVATDTLDADGVLTARQDCPTLTAAAVAAVLPRFIGSVAQVPPMASAIKVGGRRLYELQRRGESIERAPRQVNVYQIDLLGFFAGERPVAYLDVLCSKGTYIRSLCADLGAALGIPAHMGFLVRTAAGSFRLSEALRLAELAEPGAALPHLLPLTAAVAHLPALPLEPEAARRVGHGVAPRLPAALLAPLAGQTVTLRGSGGSLLALAEVAGEPPELRLKRVL